MKTCVTATNSLSVLRYLNKSRRLEKPARSNRERKVKTVLPITEEKESAFPGQELPRSRIVFRLSCLALPCRFVHVAGTLGNLGSETRPCLDTSCKKVFLDE